jgi:PAS domain S-box-containing protein
VDQRQLAQQLHEAKAEREQLLRSFEALPVACCTLNSNGAVHDANPAAAELLGVPREELEGRKLSAFFSGAELVQFEDGLEQELQVEQPEGPLPMVPAKRELTLTCSGKLVRARVVPLAAVAGSESRYLVSLEDVTALHALRDHEARFLQIAAHVEDVYYQTDESNQIIYASLAYQHVWGRDPQTAPGQHWFQAVHAEDLPQAREARRLLLKGDPFDEEYRIVRPDGSIRWIRDRAFLLDQPSRQIVGVARDVTDDRDLEEELRQAQKLEALGTLASSVAHDFGNLLQGVMGCLNMALRDTTTVDRSRDYTRQALTAVRGGATLVGQLMTFGRKDRARPGAIAIDTAIYDCSKLLQRLLGDHIELCIETSAPGAMLLADPVQVEQILMNLAANARDAMPGGGRLVIKTETVLEAREPEGRAVPYIRLEVRDIGCGMDRETQARVFEPFFTTKAAGRGTGLGLSAVRAVTRALGGRVTLESELGRGTTFVFHIPSVASAPVVHQRAPAHVAFAGRALLVEDDWRVRMSVRQYLEDLGFDVVEAADAVEALSRAKGTLTLLVTDVVLPEVSGPKIREMLKGQYPDLKALYISAHPALYLLEQGLLQNSDVILQKPFDIKDLQVRLTELCSRSSEFMRARAAPALRHGPPP